MAFSLQADPLEQLLSGHRFLAQVERIDLFEPGIRSALNLYLRMIGDQPRALGI